MSGIDTGRVQGPASIRQLAAQPHAGAAETRTAQGGRNREGAGVVVETGAPVTAGEPPVDTQRVAEIQAALRKGSYPLVPARIADAMIAARLMLSAGQ